jgi:hypothetical protein
VRKGGFCIVKKKNERSASGTGEARGEGGRGRCCVGIRVTRCFFESHAEIRGSRGWIRSAAAATAAQPPPVARAPRRWRRRWPLLLGLLLLEEDRHSPSHLASSGPARTRVGHMHSRALVRATRGELGGGGLRENEAGAEDRGPPLLSSLSHPLRLTSSCPTRTNRHSQTSTSNNSLRARTALSSRTDTADKSIPLRKTKSDARPEDNDRRQRFVLEQHTHTQHTRADLTARRPASRRDGSVR